MNGITHPELCGKCETCGHEVAEHERRIKRIRAGDLTPDKDGNRRLYLHYATKRKPASSVMHFEYNGKLYTARELEEISGINRRTIYDRINIRGWSVKRAVEAPLDHTTGRKPKARDTK